MDKKRIPVLPPKTTSTYRKIDGKRFIIDDVYRTKEQAKYMAGFWRARGMYARIMDVKGGKAIYIRKRS